MPILPAETDLHPPDLLETQDHDEDAAKSWWALYTQSRREKDLMRRLKARDVSFYSPIIPKRARSRQGRLRTSYQLLFPSYVFLYGSDSDRYEAVSLGCVSRCIRVPDGEGLRRDLLQICRLIQSGQPLTPESRFPPGRHVRVRKGPLRGCEGVILRRQKETRLLVAVNFLQRGASLLLEDCDVEDLGNGSSSF